MRDHRATLSILLLPFCLGCPNSEDVRVPRVDNTPPSVEATLFYRGEIQARSGGEMAPFDRSIAEEDEDLLFVPGGVAVDDGGVSRIEVTYRTSLECYDFEGIEPEERTLIGSTGLQSESWIAEQEGEIGSTVQNSLSTGQPMRMSQFQCDDGWTLSSATILWRVEAEDFHGNIGSYGEGGPPPLSNTAWPTVTYFVARLDPHSRLCLQCRASRLTSGLCARCPSEEEVDQPPPLP